MMNKPFNKTKIASSLLVKTVLLSSLASTSFAAGSQTQSVDANNGSTYWGLGIGSVLGGVIAGPPGIALGAALGGSFGWGQDQSEALEQSRELIHEKEALERENIAALNRSNQRLKAASARIGELKQTKEDQEKDLQSLRLALEDKEQALSQSDLAQVLNNYTQEIYFEKGESHVPGYARERVVKLAEFVRSYPQLQVNLTGYTDQSGSAEFNQRLSQSRAESIRDALLVEGVDASRIVLEAQGESMAKVDSSDSGNTILDRRVAIEFSLPDDSIANSDELVSQIALEGGVVIEASVIETSAAEASVIHESVIDEVVHQAVLQNSEMTNLAISEVAQ